MECGAGKCVLSGWLSPRIHFAINCGSNGCPALRPSAYLGDGLRETLRAATRQFLDNGWNCRIDHAVRRLYISRIFKMYAQDFAGAQGTTQDYRLGVLRFVAQHLDVPFEQIADYEVVYNVYDWGLNEGPIGTPSRSASPPAMRGTTSGIDPARAHTHGALAGGEKISPQGLAAPNDGSPARAVLTPPIQAV